MNTSEYISNAKECAHDALVLLEAAEKMRDQNVVPELMRRAASWLKTGHDEAIMAADSVGT